MRGTIGDGGERRAIPGMMACVLKASRNGLTFDVRSWGPPDGDPVLLLHGFPQNSASWEAVATRLADRGYRVVAPDQRGYSPGARPPGRDAYRMRELVADALAVVDELVAPGARVHLVGHDWGAAVSWAIAAHHPDRLRTLTAVSVPAPGAFMRALVSTRQALASWYMYVIQLPRVPERLLSAGGQPYSRRFAALLRRSGQSPRAAERDAAILADPAALIAALNWYRAMFTGGRRRGGGSRGVVTVPTLFVWSDGDVAITRQAAELTHQYVDAPFRFVELRGVSHWIPDEVPDQLAALLLEHMAEYPS